LFDAFQKTRGGKTGLERDADHFGAGGAGGFVVEKFGPVGSELATFGHDFGREADDKFARGWLIVLGDVINAGQIRQNFGAFVSRVHEGRKRRGAGGVFGASAGVAAHANDEDIAKAARVFEQAYVTGMQQIEGAGDANEPLSVAFPLATLENQISLRNDCQFPLLRSDFRVQRKVHATQQQFTIQFIILSREAEMHGRAA
jgi:hypothetical protein